jgi:hypothetical protein
MSSFDFLKMFSEKKMEFVPNGVLGGYGYGTGVVWSTWRVLSRSWEMVI